MVCCGYSSAAYRRKLQIPGRVHPEGPHNEDCATSSDETEQVVQD